MRSRQLAGILSAITTVSLAAACDHGKATEVDTPEYAAVTENLTLQPAPIIIGQGHPWAGRTVRIRDYTGDVYDRCLGPDALPAANVRVSAQLCWPRGLDSLQLFTIVGFSSPLPMVDGSRVALRSIYNSNFCIDVEWGTANGGELSQMYPCHYGANQMFHLPMPATANAFSATGAIRTKNSNYQMGFEAGAPDNRGTVKPIWQRTYSAAVNFQRWTMELR